MSKDKKAKTLGVMTAEMATLLDEFKVDISKDASVSTEQRDQANIDMRFINVIGGQWEDFEEDRFDGRLRPEYDLVGNAVHRFIAEWNQNRVGVNYKPSDSATSDDDSKLLNNLFRTDFRQFSGKEALDNAVLEAVTCGVGYLRLGTRHEEEEDESTNRRTVFIPIHNGFNSVFFNKGAQRKDKADALHCTVITGMSRDEFETKFPGFEPVSIFDPHDRKEFNFSANENNIHIGTRYDVMTTSEKVFIYDNITTLKKESFSEKEHEEQRSAIKNDPTLRFSEEKQVVKRRIRKSVFSGQDFLKQPKIIAGKWIPIIPIYAYRVFVDGQEWFRGLVRKLIDAQRTFNMQMGQLMENAAMQSTDIPMVAPDQIPPEYESDWDDLTNAPYVRLQPLLGPDGQMISQGPIGMLKAPQISPSQEKLLTIIPAFLKEMTGIDPSDDPNRRLESGKAKIEERKTRNLNTQPIMDNIFTGIEQVGDVYQSIAIETYEDRREMMLMREDGTESNQQFVKTTFEEDLGQLVEMSVFRNKKFRAYADIGPQYEAQREAELTQIIEILQMSGQVDGITPYVPLLAAELFKKMPGLSEGIQNFNRNQMLKLGMIKPESEEEIQIVTAAQESQKTEQDKLFEAAAKQAESEGEERTAKVADNLASAKKKGAETVEILTKLPFSNAETQSKINKNQSEIEKSLFENVQGLPLPQSEQ